MDLSNNQVRALFGLAPTARETISEKAEKAAQAYIRLHYARIILTRELVRFQGKQVAGIKYPSIYINIIQRALARLSIDMRKLQDFMQKHAIHVSEKASLSPHYIEHLYWVKGVKYSVGGAPFVLSRNVEKTLRYYMVELNDHQSYI